MIVGKSQDSIKRNIVDEMERIFPSYVRYFPGKREMFLCGRQVYTVGASDARAVTKIKGSTLSGALADEATELPEDFFNMLVSRISRPGAQLIFTTNPDTPFHWLKKNYLDRPEETLLKEFKFTIEDNPSLDALTIHALKTTYRGLWYKRYIEGQWAMAEGAVYDFFNEPEHVLEYAPSYAKFYTVGVDYGTTNPCAFVLVGFNDEVQPSLWVEKEYYFNSREMGYQKTDFDYAQDLNNFCYGHNVQKIYVDPSAASFKLEVRRSFPHLQMADAKNDVLNGIRCVSNFLTTGELKVLRNCSTLIGEFSSYVWDEKAAKRGIDQPLKAHDHLADATRYAVHTQWGEKKSLKVKTLQEREAEILKERARQNPAGPWGWGYQKL